MQASQTAADKIKPRVALFKIALAICRSDNGREPWKAPNSKFGERCPRKNPINQMGTTRIADAWLVVRIAGTDSNKLAGRDQPRRSRQFRSTQSRREKRIHAASTPARIGQTRGRKGRGRRHAAENSAAHSRRG